MAMIQNVEKTASPAPSIVGADQVLPDWRSLARITERQLGKIDIAVVNLSCGTGLPGCSAGKLHSWLQKLDTWVTLTRQFTERMMLHFYSGQCDYPDSEPRFRIQCMITHLQRDLGLRFRLDKRTEDAVSEPSDSFVHGIFQGTGGTCGSLPVIYTSVGRRLGYPLKLVSTKCHLYMRWEGKTPDLSFNIETAGDGVSFFPDNYYHTGRYEMPAEAIFACGYLRPLSPREELASFLCERAECWMQERKYCEAATSYAWANEIDPQRGQYRFLFRQSLGKWDQELRRLLPTRGFPKLEFRWPPQYFSRLLPTEQNDFIRLSAMDKLLKDPVHDRNWWSPLRNDSSSLPKDVPTRLEIDFRWELEAALPETHT